MEQEFFDAFWMFEHPEQAVPESPPETRLLQLLRRNGFPTPSHSSRCSTRVASSRRVDLAYPQWRLAIEYESLAHHTGSDAVLRDSARRNSLRSATWETITATIDDLRLGWQRALFGDPRRARDRFLASEQCAQSARLTDAKTLSDGVGLGAGEERVGVVELAAVTSANHSGT